MSIATVYAVRERGILTWLISWRTSNLAALASPGQLVIKTIVMKTRHAVSGAPAG
jgi:hypothetical protein